MNKKNKITTIAALLCAISGLACSTPAESQTLSDVLRNVLGNNNSNFGYNQSFNSNQPSAQQSQTMMNLETRRMQLSSQISQAVADGRMSSSQANNLTLSLSSNANLQNSYSSDGNFTFAEAQSLLNVLSDIDTSVQASISAYPGYANSNVNAGYYGGQYQRQGNRGRNSLSHSSSINHSNSINRSQSEILSRLQSGKADRRLTNSEYAGLKGEYDRIASSEIQFRSQGGFSRQETRNVQSRLDDLNLSITQQLENGNNSNWSGRNRNRSNYSWQ